MPEIGVPIHGWYFIASSEVVAVIALVDLRRHLGLEPPAQSHSSHWRFPNYRQLVGQNIFFLIYLATQYYKCRHLHTAGRKLRPLAHRRRLLQHVPSRFGVQHHGFVYFREQQLCGRNPKESRRLQVASTLI